MKARPRCAERTLARLLSDEFEKAGFSRVERIPVLGREGPDIEINELGLVIDVKSRLEVPRGYFEQPMDWGIHCAFPLSMLMDPQPDPVQKHSTSILVTRWLDHMDEWRRENYPDGISMLLLHRPQMPYGKAVIVIYSNLLVEYRNRWKKSTQSSYRPTTP
jgi:hypothetical protein